MFRSCALVVVTMCVVAFEAVRLHFRLQSRRKRETIQTWRRRIRSGSTTPHASDRRSPLSPLLVKAGSVPADDASSRRARRATARERVMNRCDATGGRLSALAGRSTLGMNCRV
jgi:hypothetical protein